MRLRIRRATLGDATTLAAFNSAMALETEGKVLLPRVIGAGVRACCAAPDQASIPWPKPTAKSSPR